VTDACYIGAMPQRPLRAPVPVIVAALLLTLAACAPALDGVDASAFETPAALEVERAAQEAYHRMELGRLRLGVYTTNVLVDLDLPRGARVTVEAFGDDDYRLRFTSDAALDLAWLVTPDGVRRTTP
jgi:hypothetical protein